jgi:hypothetical protein
MHYVSVRSHNASAGCTIRDCRDLIAVGQREEAPFARLFSHFFTAPSRVPMVKAPFIAELHVAGTSFRSRLLRLTEISAAGIGACKRR